NLGEYGSRVSQKRINIGPYLLFQIVAADGLCFTAFLEQLRRLRPVASVVEIPSPAPTIRLYADVRQPAKLALDQPAQQVLELGHSGAKKEVCFKIRLRLVPDFLGYYRRNSAGHNGSFTGCAFPVLVNAHVRLVGENAANSRPTPDTLRPLL